jgi:hypothetical protein
MASTITGCLRFHDSDAFRKREPKTDAALTTTGAPLGPDGLFHIKLDGQIRTMRRIGVVCSGGAGETPGGPPPRPNLSVSPEPVKPPGLGSVGIPAPQPNPTPAQAPVAPPAAVPAPPPAVPQATGGDSPHVPVEGPPPVVYPSTGAAGVPGAAPSTGVQQPPPGGGAPQ